MNSKIILLFLGVFLSSLIYAQDSPMNYKDKVILNNGSTLIGKIIEYNPDSHVALELQVGSVVNFKVGQIKSIHMYEDRGIKPVASLKIKKVYHEGQFSLLPGESGSGVSLSYNALWQNNSRLAFGPGFGIDNYFAREGRDVFPVYANVRYYLTDHAFAPYIGGKLGYGMAFKNEDAFLFSANGGIMVNPQFGIRLGTGGMIFNLYSGLKFQKADYEFITSWETRTEEILYRRVEIGASVMF